MITVILNAKDFEVKAPMGHKQLEGTFKHAKFANILNEYKADGLKGIVIKDGQKVMEF